MARLMPHIPAATATVWILLAKLTGFTSVLAQLLALLPTAAGSYSTRRLAAKNEASPIHKAMAWFTAAASGQRLDRGGRLACALSGRGIVSR